jgi:hypothetical protein
MVPGPVASGDVEQAEVLALQWAQIRFARGYFVEHPDDMAALALWSTLSERYSRGLERLGIGAAARARLGVDTFRAFDLASHWAAEDEDVEGEASDG